MEKYRDTIATSYGRVSLLHFPPTKVAARKKVVCIHGYCCDARIFTYLGSELSGSGIDVYSIDLFGHGKSDGRRGDMDFENMMKALKEVIDRIRDGSKVILLGHSLGCTFALWYAKTFSADVEGLILMSIYVRLKGMISAGEAVPSIPTFLKLFLMRYLAPNRRIPATKVVKKSVLQTREVQEMLKDPQINYWYSYSYLIDVLANKNKDAYKMADIEVPTLIMHGKNDRNVFSTLSEKYFELVKSKKKSIKLFDCDHWYYRAIFYNQNDHRYDEQQRNQVVEAISSWVGDLENQ